MTRVGVLPPAPETAAYLSRMEIKELAGTTRIRQETQDLHASEGPKARPGRFLGVLEGL